MPIWLVAGLWGLLGSSALVIGAALAYLANFPRRLIADIMAFGCGVLISAVAYDLIEDGFLEGGLWPIVGGSLLGSAAYTIANIMVSRRGARHRKRSGDQQRHEQGKEDVNEESSGLAIAIGSMLDGIPESIVLGVGLLQGGNVSIAVLVAIFLSNLPEGLSSAAGMRRAGRSPIYVFGLWGGIALLSACASTLGAGLFGTASPWVLAMVNAIAAGALLTMIAETMIPEAVAGERSGTGILVVLGLLAAFVISQLGR
jgi:zinc transporter, ZIP family